MVKKPKLFIALCTLPALILTIIFMIAPMLNAIYLSFTSSTALSVGFNSKFVFFDNYIYMFRDKDFLQALYNTFKLMLVIPAVTIFLSLVFAFILTQGQLKEKSFYRTVFFFPSIVSMTVVGIVWSFVFNPTRGILNHMLDLFHLSTWKHAWLGEGKTALWCIGAALVWQAVGYYMVMHVASIDGISQEIYDLHYQEQKMTTQYAKVLDGSGQSASASPSPGEQAQQYNSSVTMKVTVLSDSFTNQLKDIAGDETKIMAYIKDQYNQDGIQSNLTVYNKIGYIESYMKLDSSLYHYWALPGEYNGKLFTVDTASASKFISDIENVTETYTTPQSEEKSVPVKKQVSSKGKKIIILNGSKISGLAAAKQKTLVDAGYTVPKVGDYTQEVLTRTKIIVSKKKWGADLTTYFKDPQLVVGQTPDGYDIEIILGTVDAN